MKIKVHGLHLGINEAIEHSRVLGKTSIMGVILGKARGLCRVSPNGDYTYIQPLPRRFTKESTFTGA